MKPDPGARWRALFVITSSDIGGSEVALRELVLRLDRREFDPVVVSLCPTGQLGSEIAASGVPVVTLGMSERPRPWELVAGTLRLARLIDNCKIDIVQSFLYRANVTARLASRISRRRPVVVSSHRSLRPFRGRLATLAMRLTRSLSDRAVVVSQAVLEQLTATECLPLDRVVVIENGVDTDRFEATGGREAREYLGIGPGTLVVGAVGRLSPKKGLHHLLVALAQVRSRGAPLNLVLAGDGPERGRLELEASGLGLDGHVTFLGVRRDLRSVYAAFDIFALPSLEEGSPNSLLEAMAAGRAVVATNVGGVSEIIEDGRSGLLVQPGAPASLAEALMRLAGDEALRRRLGAAARLRVAECFAISRTVEKHVRLYRELLGQALRSV